MTRQLPAWISATTLAVFVGAVLFAVGWIKPYLAGPDLSVATVYMPKPIPVRVETVKWLTKEHVKTERIQVPVEVIREVPAKVEKRLQSDFGFSLGRLKEENRELLNVLDVPKAPFGGQMAVTASTASGKVDGVFRPNAAPFISFGGIREAGAQYDVISKQVGGYYRQDLVRVGPAVVVGEASLRNGKAGVAVGVAVRF